MEKNFPEWIPSSYIAFITMAQIEGSHPDNGQSLIIFHMMSSDFQKDLISRFTESSPIQKKMWLGLSDATKTLDLPHTLSFYLSLHTCIEQASFAAKNDTLDAFTEKKRIKVMEKLVEDGKAFVKGVEGLKQESNVFQRLAGMPPQIRSKDKDLYKSVIADLRTVSVSRPVISDEDVEILHSTIGYLELYLQQLKGEIGGNPRLSSTVPAKSFTKESSTTSKYIAAVFTNTFGSPHYGNVANICNVIGFMDISKDKVTQTFNHFTKNSSLEH
ncbi:hypothetical protein OFO16_14355 [Vibrio natriegens]|uniref:hypothetical protein n=1 Tax=Vibrio natriegens TaxID=691 RepID=UPI0021E749E9|nr:hypothetical protein [Vibrio natriegens]UYI46952.1 hypothetical protein OFO16_14355 [Vibrio natriegens]